MEFVWWRERARGANKSRRATWRSNRSGPPVHRLLIGHFLRVANTRSSRKTKKRAEGERERERKKRKKKWEKELETARACGSFNAQTREPYRWKTSSCRSTIRHVITIDTRFSQSIVTSNARRREPGNPQNSYITCLPSPPMQDAFAAVYIFETFPSAADENIELAGK